jgi:hypothetical protein
MKNLFKNPWIYVAVMAVLLLLGFLGRQLGYVGSFVLKVVPSDNQRVLSSILIVVKLVFPLVLTYFVAKLVVGNKKYSR